CRAGRTLALRRFVVHSLVCSNPTQLTSRIDALSWHTSFVTSGRNVHQGHLAAEGPYHRASRRCHVSQRDLLRAVHLENEIVQSLTVWSVVGSLRLYIPMTNWTFLRDQPLLSTGRANVPAPK